MINHIDVFSGIGGFAYAAQRVWGKDYHNVLFCDNNKFCQQVIKKNFGKDSLIYGDIREITRSRVIADTDSRKPGESQTRDRGEDFGRRSKEGFDLLTGGFPCQPFSCAGKRRGTEDNRYLWPEMLRVILEFKPTWVIAENVRGLLTISEGLVFEQVCADLEREGYQVQPFIIPAVAVNAPHRRDRVWIIANAKGRSDRRYEREKSSEGKSSCGCVSQDDVSNSKNKRFQRGKQADGSKGEKPDDQLLYGRNREWEINWLEVATRLCGVDDGLPCELDGFKLSKAGHRVERLKALGNAIVPQVAIEIMKAIKYAEEN